MTDLLRAEGLVVRYGGVAALDAVDLSVGAGELVGLVGANGAGKTTLLDCLSGHFPPAAGRVWLDDEEIGGRGPAARARMGVIRCFQDARLFPTMPVREALVLAHERDPESHGSFGWQRFGWLRSMTSPEGNRLRRRAAFELAQRMHLDPLLHRLVGELSTGERKRLDVACAIGLQPRLLLLDEPSAGLAASEVPELEALVRQAGAATGTAVVMVEHDLPLVWRLVDRVVVLDNGRIVAAGAPEALRGHPSLAFGRLS